MVACLAADASAACASGLSISRAAITSSSAVPCAAQVQLGSRPAGPSTRCAAGQAVGPLQCVDRGARRACRAHTACTCMTSSSTRTAACAPMRCARLTTCVSRLASATAHTVRRSGSRSRVEHRMQRVSRRPPRGASHHHITARRSGGPSPLRPAAPCMPGASGSPKLLTQAWSSHPDVVPPAPALQRMRQWHGCGY